MKRFWCVLLLAVMTLNLLPMCGMAEVDDGQENGETIVETVAEEVFEAKTEEGSEESVEETVKSNAQEVGALDDSSETEVPGSTPIPSEAELKPQHATLIAKGTVEAMNSYTASGDSVNDEIAVEDPFEAALSGSESAAESAPKAAWENNPWVKEWLAEKAAYEERAAKEAAAAEAAKKAEEEAAKSEEVEAETLTPAKFNWQKYWAERRAAAMKAAWENNPWVKEWLAEKAAYEERAAKEAAAAEAAKKAEEEAAKLEQWKKMTWWVTDSIQLTEGQSWLRTGATKTSESIVVIPRGTKLIYHPSESKVDEKGQVRVEVIYNGQVGWVSTKYTDKSVVIDPAKPAPIWKHSVFAETGSTVLRDVPNKDTGKFVDTLMRKYGAVEKSQIGVLKVDAPVYKQSGSKLKRNGTAKAGTMVMVYAYNDDWVRCKSVTGKTSYIPKAAVKKAF